MVKYVTALLIVIAVGLAGLLLYISHTKKVVLGCAAGSSCEEVLFSRWALWFGVPVSLLAMLVYTAMLAAVLVRDPESKRPNRLAQWVMLFGSLLSIGAALWFIVVQFALVKAVCAYCMSTHTAAVAAAVLCLLVVKPMQWVKGTVSALVATAGLMAVLIVGQFFTDDPAAPAPQILLAKNMSANTAPSASPKAITDNPVPLDASLDISIETQSPQPATPIVATSSPQSRIVKLFGGRFKVDTAEAPIIGKADAPIVIAIVFDYNCAHCRATRTMLEGTKEKFGDKLAIVCLPTPLEADCNKYIRRTGPNNHSSCELAQISLAVWRLAPDKWVEFEKKLYTEDIRTPARCQIAAWDYVGGEKELKKGLDDPWVEQQIQYNTYMYYIAGKSGVSTVLPMIFSEHGVMNGSPRSQLDIDDFIRTIKADTKSY